MKSHPFLNPSKSYLNIHLYVVRKSILDAVTRHKKDLSGVLLDVGCGQMPYKSLLKRTENEDGGWDDYIGLDLEVNPIHDNQPDLTWDGRNIPMGDETVESILLTEVLEHVPEPAGVLDEISRVLKPGGVVLVTVPFLFPLHEVPYDYYRYTPFALSRLAEDAGFAVEELEALGGWDASLALMIGLWLRRRKMSRWLKLCFAAVLYPIYCWLLRAEAASPPVQFMKQPMLTGTFMLARKKS